ncbi:MAG: BamA/TamA family outer membrane protein [Rhizobiales bacterium]|nr:BamA/TamA family outer membrane protein [Hyphomicrobiales bacterium]
MSSCLHVAGRRRLATFVFFAAVFAQGAQAFAFLGLFGDKPPEPTSTTLPYSVEFDAGGDKAVARMLEDASALRRLRDDAPPDGETVVRRALIDAAALYDALWAEGYYDARLDIRIAGVALPQAASEAPAAAVRAAETFRGRAVVPIEVAVAPGPQFTVRALRVTDGQGHLLALPERAVGLAPGDPARAADLRAARVRVIDFYRAESRPLTKGGDIAITVDHRAKQVDAVIPVTPGAVAPVGAISIEGTKDVDPAVVRSFVYVEPGDPYSPQAMADVRKSALRVQALGSARVREATALAADGSLPIVVEVTERPKRLIGGAIRYSTLDGPALRAYWEHRNLFGGAEYLRLEAETFMVPRIDGTKIHKLGDLRWRDMGGRVRATFLKPALGGSRFDFVAGALAERTGTGGTSFGGYTSQLASLEAGLRYRFADRFFVQGLLKYEQGWTRDALGKLSYRMIGVPISLNYDTTDKPLDPTRGVKFVASATPWAGLGGSASFVETRIAGSAYYALDEDARYVIAARLGLGSVFGAALGDIPASHRFYAGGGASVRGYRLASIGPLAPNGDVIGGRSLIEGSLEARIKVTDTLGVVPFVDAGSAFAASAPDFSRRIQFSAGVGLRYYTAVGPIRLDVAVPVNRRPGDRKFGLYIGVGQAF